MKSLLLSVLLSMSVIAPVFSTDDHIDEACEKRPDWQTELREICHWEPSDIVQDLRMKMEKNLPYLDISGLIRAVSLSMPHATCFKNNVEKYHLTFAERMHTKLIKIRYWQVLENIEEILAGKKKFSYVVNLQFANFKNLHLERINLSRARLKGANFSEAKLEHMNLSSSNLTGAIFTDATLTHVNLTRACFRYAQCHNVKFSGNSILKGANFLRAELTNSIFGDSILTNTVFFEACMNGSDFKGSGEILQNVTAYPLPPVNSEVMLSDFFGGVSSYYDGLLKTTDKPENERSATPIEEKPPEDLWAMHYLGEALYSELISF